MRKLHIALCLIEQDGKYLMQLRDGDPKIGGAGLVGFFGGKIEDGETPAQAAHREMGEETTHVSKPQDFSFVGEVNVISDHKLELVEVKAHVHKIVIDAATKLEAAEGKLVSMTLQEVKDSLDQLTTGTRAYFESFILQEE